MPYGRSMPAKITPTCGRSGVLHGPKPELSLNFIFLTGAQRFLVISLFVESAGAATSWTIAGMYQHESVPRVAPVPGRLELQSTVG